MGRLFMVLMIPWSRVRVLVGRNFTSLVPDPTGLFRPPLGCGVQTNVKLCFANVSLYLGGPSIPQHSIPCSSNTKGRWTSGTHGKVPGRTNGCHRRKTPPRVSGPGASSPSHQSLHLCSDNLTGPMLGGSGLTTALSTTQKPGWMS